MESTNKIWHYTQFGVQAGPVAAEQLVALARSGQLLRTDLVWKEGMANWVEAGTARGLFPTPEAVPTPSATEKVEQPPEPARQADVVPTSNAVWYYEERGARVGPVSAEQIATLLESASLTATSYVWKKGLSGWTALIETELSAKISASDEPPALAGEHVSNMLAWVAAFVPILSHIVESYVSQHTKIAPMAVIAATAGANTILCLLDQEVLRKAGHTAKRFTWWVFLVPVYLYQRAKYLGQSKAYFVCWLVTFALSLTLPLTYFDRWFGIAQTHAPDVAAKGDYTSAATESSAPPTPSSVQPQLSQAQTAQTGVEAPVINAPASVDPVFSNVAGMAAAAKVSNWQEVDTRHAALYQLAPPQRGDQEASKQANKEGLAAITANNTEEAVQAFAKSLAADPANVEARNNLAYAHMLAGHFEDAERGLIETLGIAPDRASAWANLSDLTARQGHRDASLACLRLTVRYSKDRSKVLSYLAKAADENSNQLYRQVASEVLKEFDAIPSYVSQ